MLRLIKSLRQARYEVRVSYGVALLTGSPVFTQALCSEQSRLRLRRHASRGVGRV